MEPSLQLRDEVVGFDTWKAPAATKRDVVGAHRAVSRGDGRPCHDGRMSRCTLGRRRDRGFPRVPDLDLVASKTIPRTGPAHREASHLVLVEGALSSPREDLEPPPRQVRRRVGPEEAGEHVLQVDVISSIPAGGSGGEGKLRSGTSTSTSRTRGRPPGLPAELFSRVRGTIRGKARRLAGLGGRGGGSSRSTRAPRPGKPRGSRTSATFSRPPCPPAACHRRARWSPRRSHVAHFGEYLRPHLHERAPEGLGGERIVGLAPARGRSSGFLGRDLRPHLGRQPLRRMVCRDSMAPHVWPRWPTQCGPLATISRGKAVEARSPRSWRERYGHALEGAPLAASFRVVMQISRRSAWPPGDGGGVQVGVANQGAGRGQGVGSAAPTATRPSSGRSHPRPESRNVDSRSATTRNASAGAGRDRCAIPWQLHREHAPRLRFTAEARPAGRQGPSARPW